MARAALKNITSKATKPKKKKATSVAKLKLGDEPSFIIEPSKVELARAFNWYRACAVDSDQHKEWVEEYLANRGWNSEQIKVVGSKVKKLIPVNIYLARLFNRHQPLDVKYDAENLSYFESVYEKHNDQEFDEEGNPVFKAPVTRVRTNVAPMVEFIEEQIEAVMAGGKAESVYTKLQEMGCNGAAASQLKNIFAFQTEEFIELSKPSICDEELEEAYRFLRVPTRKALGAFMKQLNEDLVSFAQVVKKTRKPRKKKPVKVEKLVSRVKYKAKDDTYKIASVSPDKIVGAQWLWVFNTKYRILAFYKAKDGTTLSIKGTTVLNYQECGQKKLRKPEQQLAGFTSGAVKALPKNFEAIKTTAATPNGRINEDTVLLRVFV